MTRSVDNLWEDWENLDENVNISTSTVDNSVRRYKTVET